MKEENMVDMIFLGKNCEGGVSTNMFTKLTTVTADLLAQWNLQGQPGGTFENWCGIRQNHKATHANGHASGNAIDINFDSNPYIATRTKTANGVIYGGEATNLSEIRMARVRATVVYDRAMAFFTSSADVADVSARHAGESTANVYDRFFAASEALRQYLQLALRPTMPSNNTPPPIINRVPTPNAHIESLATLTSSIPLTERLDDTDSRNNIQSVLNDPGFSGTHPNWSTDVDFWFRQILSDYEVVRIPMVWNANPSLAPQKTRNPTNGFLDLRRELVISLCDLPPFLMRWGICDFGDQASGDVQHFDLKTPRTPSNSSSGVPVKIDVNTAGGIQQALASLNFDPGVVDGIPGNLTQAAVDQFRQIRGLSQGGIDDTLRKELNRALQEAAIPF